MCMVRDDPAIPTQGVLRALVRMKESGEIERIVRRYGATGYSGEIRRSSLEFSPDRWAPAWIEHLGL